MSPELWQSRIRVMVEGIDRITAFIGDSYAFVRLGEAVHHIPDEVADTHPEIEWGDIRHFRNFMIHVYHAVDPGRLYDTAKDSLPPLRPKLEAMLDQNPG